MSNPLERLSKPSKTYETISPNIISIEHTTTKFIIKRNSFNIVLFANNPVFNAILYNSPLGQKTLSITNRSNGPIIIEILNSIDPSAIRKLILSQHK